MNDEFDYRALGVHHHEKSNEVQPLEHTSVRATLVVVGIFLACFLGALLAIGVIHP